MLTKEELQSISNLIFSGKWNLSMQESEQVIKPLLNKISSILAEMDKPKDKKDKVGVKNA